MSRHQGWRANVRALAREMLRAVRDARADPLRGADDATWMCLGGAERSADAIRRAVLVASRAGLPGAQAAQAAVTLAWDRIDEACDAAETARAFGADGEAERACDAFCAACRELAVAAGVPEASS